MMKEEGITDALNLGDEDWVIVDATEIPAESLIPLSMFGRPTAHLGELKVPKFISERYGLRVIAKKE